MRAILPLVLVAGSSAVPIAPAPRPVPAPSVDSPFTKQLLEVGKDFRKWGRYDDEYRWAPYLCRMPMPATAHPSASKDEDTHGQKLYSLLIKDHKSYPPLMKTPTAAIGQVVVKESWVPEESDPPTGKDDIVTKVDQSDQMLKVFGSMDHFRPYAKKGDKWYKASKPAGLFVMMKLDPKTPDTDEGWVYGTLTPDGRTVTAAGKIESCMKCHLETKTDRLFGLSGK